MNPPSKFPTGSPVKAVLVPSNRFFLRIVPLVEGVSALEQAGLALEGLAPFPLAQLYWGCCVAPTRDRALVYAAYRRRFDAEETGIWESADLVAPDALLLMGTAPTEPGLRVLTGKNGLRGAAWDGQSTWPVAVMAREYAGPMTGELQDCFVRELRARADVPADSPVLFVEGEPQVHREADQLVLALREPGGAAVATTRLLSADQNMLDVRDRAFMAGRHRELKRGELLWRLLLAGGVAAAVAGLLDVGALALHWRDRLQHEQIARQLPVVEKLEAAHGLTARVDDLAHRQLRFFEMLALVNQSRPKSIVFTRTGANGLNLLEIEARTDQAGDVPVYETALRNLPALERVEIKGLRARDGQTVFGLQVAFKAGAVAGNGGAP